MLVWAGRAFDQIQQESFFCPEVPTDARILQILQEMSRESLSEGKSEVLLPT